MGAPWENGGRQEAKPTKWIGSPLPGGGKGALLSVKAGSQSRDKKWNQLRILEEHSESEGGADTGRSAGPAAKGHKYYLWGP